MVWLGKKIATTSGTNVQSASARKRQGSLPVTSLSISQITMLVIINT